MFKLHLPDVTQETYFLAIFPDILSSKMFMRRVYFSVVGQIDWLILSILKILAVSQLFGGLQILFSGVLICLRECTSIRVTEEW